MSDSQEVQQSEAPAPAPAASEDPLMIIADAIENGQMPPNIPEPPMEPEAEPEPEPEAQEAAPEEPEEEEPKEEESLASSWRAIKEAEVRNTKERAEIKAELEQLKRLQGESQDKYSEVQKVFENDPFEGLKKFGLTPDDIIDRVLNKGKAGEGEKARASQRADDRKLQEIRDSLKEQQDALKKTQDYLHSQKAEEAKGQFISEVKTTLGDSEFELMADHETITDDVWGRATTHYQQTGEILTPRETLVKLQGEFKDALKQLSTYKSTRAYMMELLGVPGTEPVRDSDKSQKPQDAPGNKPRTLKNSMSAQQPTPQVQDEPMTEYEELMAAARLITPGS